jgi:RHS repeat-associated protein
MQNQEFSDGSGLEDYDYGSRFYDQQIGRWDVPDLQAEKFYPASPYSYVVDNPLTLNDPSGKDWTITFDVSQGVVHFHIAFTGAVVDMTDNKRGKAGDVAKAITTQFESLFNEDHTKDGGVTVDATANIRAVSSIDDVHKDETMFEIEDPNNTTDLDYKDANGKTKKAAGAALNGKEIAINADNVGDIMNGDNNKTIPHEIGHTGGLSHPENNQGFWPRFFQASDQDLTRSGRNFMYSGGTAGDDLNKNPTGPTKAQLWRIYSLFTGGKLNSAKTDPISAW